MDDELKQVESWINAVEAVGRTYPHGLNMAGAGDLSAMLLHDLASAVRRMRETAGIEVPTPEPEPLTSPF